MACTRCIPDELRMNLSYKLVNSPVGVLKLVASEKGLVAILWENDDPRRVRLGDLVEEPRHPVLVRTEKELREYFARKRRTFSIPLEMRGTRFQRQVWEFLLDIPFGET
jgi:methylated-DNA-[protein]-cysteine S-methyltransferase